MKVRFAALAAGIVLCAGAAAAAEPPIYKSVSLEQMSELLKSQGATEIHRINSHGRTYVAAEAPVVGAIEVAFSECHEAPNPCGYILMSRYRNLPLTDAQLAQYNSRPDLAYVFREKGSRDVMLAFPVAVRTGLTREYIVSSFGFVSGMTEVFENWLIETLHYKPEQIYHHAE